MRLSFNPLALAAMSAVLGATLFTSAAAAADFSDLSSYSHPMGMTAGQETQAINPSLRDANGNLTVVNGQVTSATMSQQSGVQTAGATANGSGSGNSGAMFGGATAIGNSLNVITYGSNNTVIVTSKQTNNGNQEANVSINGK